MKKAFFSLLLLFCFTDLMGQLTNSNWLLPANRSNTRFTSDRFHIPRPALSLRGFDNTVVDAFKHENSHKIYGVRQLIEYMYSANVDPFLQQVIKNHIDIASQTSYPTDINVDQQAAILESKALVTLLSFIIEKNKDIGRPALTFNGWALNNLSLGYSVQQYITELTSTDVNNPAIQDAKYFIKVAEGFDIFRPSTSQENRTTNALRLESIAYRTLFSYIQLQKPEALNGSIDFGEFDDNIEKLREGFALIADPNSNKKFFTNFSQNNAFKNSTALMSMSRAGFTNNC